MHAQLEKTKKNPNQAVTNLVNLKNNTPLVIPNAIKSENFNLYTSVASSTEMKAPILQKRKEKLPAITPTKPKTISIRKEFSRQQNTNPEQKVVQRVVAPAQHDGPFNTNALKNIHVQNLHNNLTAQYGATRTNNTGISGGGTALSNQAYGSGVGNFRPDNWAKLEELTGGNPWIQCHLLNDNLGGTGVGANLSPGSSSFNHQHLLGAETQVKDWAGYTGNFTIGQVADYTVTSVMGNPQPIQNEIKQLYNVHSIPKYKKASYDYAVKILPIYLNRVANQNAIQRLNLIDQQIKNNAQLNAYAKNPANLQQYFLFYNQIYNNIKQQQYNIFYRQEYANLDNIHTLNLLFQYAYQTNFSVLENNERVWLADYVQNTFHSSFICNAVFYEYNNMQNRWDATALQTVNITYQ